MVVIWGLNLVIGFYVGGKKNIMLRNLGFMMVGLGVIMLFNLLGN